MADNTGRNERKVGKTVVKSAVGGVLMFAFAVFVMPPLYDMFCEITGIGDKTASKYEGAVNAIDESRTIKVQFIATNEATMSWDFEPNIFEVEVHPGEATRITYFAKNRTRRDMVAQAIPNIVPTSAVKYFHKTECFCFDQQPLQAGAEANMPLVFIVDRDLPKAITTITLSYSIFDVTDMFSDGVAGIN